MQNDLRTKVLSRLFHQFPFDLHGDCRVPPARDGIRLSCIINFYGRLDLLSGILCSLSEQDLQRDVFEVVLVEDRGGTDAGKAMAAEFAAVLPIVYSPLDRNFGSMGYSRNFGVAHSRGELVLFLDDDTVLLQHDFLRTLVDEFSVRSTVDAIVPHGKSSFALIEGKYDYHEPFFMTSRCTAYRRAVIAKLGGFIDQFVGQEDVEFVIRFLLAECISFNCAALEYYHPPLLVTNFRKPMAVGKSFAGLHARYPLFLWLLTIVNCSRHAPLYLLPGRRNREMGRFGIGFVCGVFFGLLGKKELLYS